MIQIEKKDNAAFIKQSVNYLENLTLQRYNEGRKNITLKLD